LVGYTTCDGCPGGNIEYAPAEMKKNGATVIHFATGMVVGYPPCPRIDFFRRFIRENFDLPVVVGTHPIPEEILQDPHRPGNLEFPALAGTDPAHPGHPGNSARL